VTFSSGLDERFLKLQETLSLSFLLYNILPEKWERRRVEKERTITGNV
jgi:hypothetical protein